MASHLSDVGFRAQDAAEWQALVLRAAEHGERLEAPGVGAYCAGRRERVWSSMLCIQPAYFYARHYVAGTMHSNAPVLSRLTGSPSADYCQPEKLSPHAGGSPHA